jgi:hypothetical protein
MLHSTPHVPRRLAARAPVQAAFSQRLIYVSVVTLYVGAVAWIFSSLITRYYGYYGLGATSPELPVVGILAGLAIFPSLWLPIALTRPSDLIIGVTYVVIYIPALLVLPFTSNPLLESSDCLEVGGLLLVGMYLLHIVRFLPSPMVDSQKNFFGDQRQHQHVVVYVLTAICVLVFAVTRGSSSGIAIGYDEIYTRRAEFMAARESSTSAVIASYAAGWLFGTLVPIIFSYLFFKRRRLLAVALSFCVSILIYITTSYKAVMLEPLFLSAAAIAVASFRKTFQTAICAGLLVALLPACYLATQTEKLSGPELEYVGLVPFRTLAVPALALTQYRDFFSANPKTYLSHVRGFSLIITYPYMKPLPAVIGNRYYGPTMEGANAGVWATDGFAAFGSIGIPISSVLLGVVLMLYDSLAKKEDLRVSTVALTFIALSLSSVSLFTTLLTQGWIIPFAAMLFLGPGLLSINRYSVPRERQSRAVPLVMRRWGWAVPDERL